MKLTAPKKITFWVSVVLVVLGLIGYFIVLPVLTPLAFWLVLAGFVLLAAANILTGL